MTPLEPDDGPQDRYGPGRPYDELLDENGEPEEYGPDDVDEIRDAARERDVD